MDHQADSPRDFHCGSLFQAALASKALAARHASLVAPLRARLPPFPTPADVAAAAGVDFRLFDGLPEQGPLVVSGSIVLVRRHRRRRVQGWLSFLGMARVVLKRARGDHEEIDAAWVAAELAAPRAALLGLSLREAARRQPWLPAWVLARDRGSTRQDD